MNDSARISSRQWELLDRVCRTNGGGVSCYGEHESTYRSLERRGLIQGKSGQQYRAVHTREGLAFWNARIASADTRRMAETTQIGSVRSTSGAVGEAETPKPSQGAEQQQCRSGR